MRIVSRNLQQEIISHVLINMLALMSMFSFFDLFQELEKIG